MSAPSPASFAAESAVFAGRLFTHWRRYPIVPIQALLFPTVLLIIYSLLVSKSMTRVTGTDSMDALIALCAVAGAMSGALGSAFTVPYERDNGLLSRFFVMPVHRASPLSGTLLAEALRTVAGTVLITVVGFALGFEFAGGPIDLAVFVAIPVLVVIVYALIVITIAVRAESRAMLTWLSTGSIGMVFAGVAPAEVVPPFVRPLIQYQPLKPTIEAMRSLATGAPAGSSLLWALAWFVVFAAVFGPLAVRGYRRAAGSET
ncbi:ABC transporter permease [Mycobacterium sp. GA-2829]|uniref:ABC transporter permease n=1 Tax=Mycobacterium sp. GA-2829 TaxID=1772283 RepID=UPI00074024EA|nr:ABC transporter permease [Mycobacterium sp. GA-2829]KUI40289.1 ABC transporter [Mycobacterium sp. GA-2829]